MPNLFAKLALLGILVGGFTLTGDLGWLAERGQRVLGTADVASAPAMAFMESAASAPAGQAMAAPAAPTEATAPSAVFEAAADTVGSSLAHAAEPTITPIDTAAHSEGGATSAPMPVSEFRPPAGGLQSVALGDLRAGDRVVVWLGSTRHRCLVFDLVEPMAGGALVYEAAAVTSQGQPLAAAGPPRRVIVTGQEASGVARGRLLRGGALHLVEAGLAGSDRAGQWLGPIESLAVIN